MIYLYECPKCEEQLEVQHGMNESPAIICMQCDIGMDKIIAPVNTPIVKGTLFVGKHSKCE